MAVASGSQLLLMVVVTVVLFTGALSQQNDALGHDGAETYLKPFPTFSEGTFDRNSEKRFDYGNVDNELLKELASGHGLDGSAADAAWKHQDDIRDWLLEKTREHVEYKVVDGLAETPLGNISQQCYDEVSQFFADFDAMQTYALKMWSSWGDTTPWFKALYTGNAKSHGAYELCKGLTKEDDGLPFGVQFCYMQAPAIEFIGIPAVVGGCFPASCSAKDLETAHKTFLGPRNGEGITYDCHEDVPWSAGAIASLSLLSLFALLCLIGSVYHVVSHGNVTRILEDLKQAKSQHVYEQIVQDGNPKVEHESALSSDASEKCVGAGESDIRYPVDDPPAYEEPIQNGEVKVAVEETRSNGTAKLMIQDDTHGSKNVNGERLALMDKMLMSFSLFHNTEKIFSTSSSSSTFGALNGIRVLSMWWVILGHSWSFPIVLRFGNPQYIISLFEKTAFMPVQNGTYSVDTFFVLSGFLVTYLTLKELSKNNGRINWFLFYFHRFWRITPLYMVVLATYATVLAYTGEGAGKDEFLAAENEKCSNYWWTNLLYINNLYPFPGQLDQQCLGHSWYLANDMQFFIISPLIVYCLYKSWKMGVSLIALLCGVSFGSTAYVCYYWGLPAYGSDTPVYNNRTSTTPGIDAGSDFIYGKPYVRIQTYLVGMMLGFIIFKMNGKQLKLNMFFNILCWTISTALACSAIYGLDATGAETAQWASILYNCLSRFTFAVAVAWVVFACITGNGGYVNSFLAWNAWIPLAKLNFAAYLIHPVIIYAVILTKKSLIHFTYVEGSYWFISSTAASYAVGFILSVLVEGPTVGIEKALLAGQRDRNRKN